MSKKTEEAAPAEANTGRIQLGEGFSVAREFYDEILQHIQRRLPEIHPQHYYTAKKLAGRDYWNLLTRSEQPLTGRCIAHMVVHGQLPLVFVPGRHEYPKRYRLK